MVFAKPVLRESLHALNARAALNALNVLQVFSSVSATPNAIPAAKRILNFLKEVLRLKRELAPLAWTPM